VEKVKTLPFPKPFPTKVVGVSFNKRQETVRKVRVGESLSIMRHPTNKTDPYAVAVVREEGAEKKLVGYVPRYRKTPDGRKKKLAESMSKSIVGGARFRAKVTALTGKEEGKTRGLVIEIKRAS